MPPTCHEGQVRPAPGHASAQSGDSPDYPVEDGGAALAGAYPRGSPQERRREVNTVRCHG
jgi:hypothetical protein